MSQADRPRRNQGRLDYEGTDFWKPNITRQSDARLYEGCRTIVVHNFNARRRRL